MISSRGVFPLYWIREDQGRRIRNVCAQAICIALERDKAKCITFRSRSVALFLRLSVRAMAYLPLCVQPRAVK